MTLERACRVLSWLLLLLSLGFAVHLYPGPDAVADRLLAEEIRPGDGVTSQSSQPGSQGVIDGVTREAVRASFRRGWYVNLVLLVIGCSASMLWLWLGSRSRSAAWLSIAGITVFVMTFVLLVIPSRMSGLEEWTALMQRLMTVKAWPFLGAEIHRMASFAVAGIALVALVFSALRRSSTALGRT